jgi:hypothetical protein
MINLFKTPVEISRLKSILEKYCIGQVLTENLIWYHYNHFIEKDALERLGIELETANFYYSIFKQMLESEYNFLLNYFYAIN